MKIDSGKIVLVAEGKKGRRFASDKDGNYWQEINEENTDAFEDAMKSYRHRKNYLSDCKLVADSDGEIDCASGHETKCAICDEQFYDGWLCVSNNKIGGIAICEDCCEVHSSEKFWWIDGKLIRKVTKRKGGERGT